MEDKWVGSLGSITKNLSAISVTARNLRTFPDANVRIKAQVGGMNSREEEVQTIYQASANAGH